MLVSRGFFEFAFEISHLLLIPLKSKLSQEVKPQRYESGSPMRSARTVAGASGYGPLLGSGRTVPVATEPSMGVGTAGRAVSYGMQSASSVAGRFLWSTFRGFKECSIQFEG